MTATQVDQYAVFIRACADDLVEQALSYVFSKDRDFQDVLKNRETRQVASMLRIRKAPVPGGVRISGKKTRVRWSIGINSDASSGTIEGVILCSNLWQNQNGASHRKNLDTSSPNGSCGARLKYEKFNIFPFNAFRCRVHGRKHRD